MNIALLDINTMTLVRDLQLNYGYDGKPDHLQRTLVETEALGATLCQLGEVKREKEGKERWRCKEDKGTAEGEEWYGKKKIGIKGE